MQLAAAASEKSAATNRLELYPRTLPAERAVKIAQVGSIAEGALAEVLVGRVFARLVPSTATAEAAEHAAARLTQARQRGGFIALKSPIRDASAIRHAVAGLDGVTGVNVTTETRTRLEEHIRAVGNGGIVLLHDATPISPTA